MEACWWYFCQRGNRCAMATLGIDFFHTSHQPYSMMIDNSSSLNIDQALGVSSPASIMNVRLQEHRKSILLPCQSISLLLMFKSNSPISLSKLADHCNRFTSLHQNNRYSHFIHTTATRYTAQLPTFNLQYHNTNQLSRSTHTSIPSYSLCASPPRLLAQ